MSDMELWAGAECTVNRVGERWFDQVSRTGHHERPDDIDRLAALGIRRVRFPVLWERVAPQGLARAVRLEEHVLRAAHAVERDHERQAEPEAAARGHRGRGHHRRNLRGWNRRRVPRVSTRRFEFSAPAHPRSHSSPEQTIGAPWSLSSGIIKMFAQGQERVARSWSKSRDRASASICWSRWTMWTWCTPCGGRV